MNRRYGIILIISFLLLTLVRNPLMASSATEEDGELDVKTTILHHLADSYEWKIVDAGEKSIVINLPIILKSKNSGWHTFMSSALKDGRAAEKGFYIADDGDYEGKIVEKNNDGTISRPLDLSLTKNAVSLILSSIILVLIFLSIAKSYKKEPMRPKKGFVGMMEIFITTVVDELIKPSIGKDYKRYAPYLLTVFFFIFFNNLMGLLPFFPGGANVTGNISVTFILALATFLVVNLTGNKAYYKDIFWPDVPTFLKVPIPIMPVIEFVGLFTKPFALMIRLFANIMAGHAIVLGLTMLIFITVELGPVINGSMTAVSLFFTIFIYFVELLVAFIQAYVFTLLSAVFIGMARAEENEPKKKGIKVKPIEATNDDSVSK
ncbi:MAG: F0F1 ATP synthase subunit A [Fermentimonas sp.]|jgi:F-type H+-transporting ATPase subunit a